MSPILYQWFYANGGAIDNYDPATVPVPANYKIPSVKITYNTTGTGAIIVFTAPTATAGSYGGAIASVSGFNGFSDLDYRVINVNSNTYTASGLIPGKTYYLRVRAYSGPNQTGTYGEYFYEKVSPPKPANVSGSTSTISETQTPDLENQSIDIGTSVGISENREVQTSLFTVTNNSKDKNKYSVAVKDSLIDTGYEYYTFGSSMFFSANINKTSGSGGIGFFTGNSGMDGYFVLIQTTANLSDSADKEVKIIKMVGGKKVILKDSQTSGKELSGVLGGISYKVDIVVKATATKRIINVYVNNFKITATDTNSTTSTNPVDLVLPITSQVAMFANTGKVSFDYIYASPLTAEQYGTGILENVYEGKYGLKTLSFLYGDKVISDRFISPNQLPFLEEFGTVAREIRKVKIKYEARPGDPVYASVGINKFVSVLGQRLSSFGAEVYVINNSGTYVPLDDSNLYSFSIIGNYIVTTGQHEYISNELSETTVAEPVIFESSWIQTEPDAKSLSSWIETQWSKQQQVVELEVFGNPLISIGDVVSVNYPKNDLDGTQKFIVTSVNNSFKEGLSTSITARSIYS